MHKSATEIADRWLRRSTDNLSEAEHRVLQSTLDRHTISTDPGKRYAEKTKTGERVADAIARVGGSWTFILSFILFLIIWTAMNAWFLGQERFDPYPFVFLNLVLSMIAALQAPVIMMSQNRQAERDRLDAAHDYEVNLKAEIEIMALHAKVEDLRSQEIALLCRQISELTELVQKEIERRGPGLDGDTENPR
ncbi:MAG: DUF1003 domain-containing protein [Rhizobiaceae bacterium]|nr:DUF1003 domain-containing protein [Rhizobiaceae bacterium]